MSDLKKSYRMITRSKKRKFLNSLATSVRKNPKLFWSFMRQSASTHEALPFSAHDAFQYFKSLLNDGDMASMQDNISPSLDTMLSSHVSETLADQVDALLNCDITICEVEKALAKLKHGKSPDVYGITAEMFHAAYVATEDEKEFVLVRPVWMLFDRIFRSGKFPRGMSIGYIQPIFKKGNKSDINNYRGITVIPFLAKWYSVLLHSRVDDFAEKYNMRAFFQSGFRRKFQVIDWMFVLQHLINMKKAEKKPIFCAFVDFRKAFDSVSRPVLWRVLHNLGLRGRILDAFVAMYSHVRCTVKVNKQFSPIFESVLGVKQGDPLSPLLFGLLIDAFCRYVEQRAPGLGVRMGLLFVAALLFADDLLLIANSADELQQLMDLLQSFCHDIQLTVNVEKTVGLVFNASSLAAAKKHPVLYKGTPLSFVEEVRYLGGVFHYKKGIQMSCSHLKGVATRAIHALHTKCHCARMTQPVVKCEMFDVLVKPILSYGAQVWVTNLYNDPHYKKCLSNDLEKLHIDFLRKLFCLRKSTPLWMILREFGRLPMFYSWWISVVKFLLRLKRMDDALLLKQAYLSDIELYRSGKSCWLDGVMTFLSKVFPNFPSEVHGRMQRVRNLRVSDVKKAMVAQWRQMWLDIESGTVKATKSLLYLKYYGGDKFQLADKTKWYKPAAHLPVFMSLDTHINLVRFRLGNHDLLVEKRRWLPEALQKSFSCLCQYCKGTEIEDELHFVFRCPHFESARRDSRFSSMLISANQDMRVLFCSADQITLANFISLLLSMR